MKLSSSPEVTLRGQVGLIMIMITLAIAAGRIAVVRSAEGDTAFLSANDRSRWATVAALVEDRTYRIDRLIEIRDASGRRRPWNTIDKVQHTGRDGQMHSYSSKPPLLATLVAGVYAVVRPVLGMSLSEQPIYMTRIILALVNLPTLLVFLAATWSVIKQSPVHDFAKLSALAVACFGTLLLPMAISLNNHLPAAAATAVAMMVYLRREGRQLTASMIPDAIWGGLAAAFAVACELPALMMFVLWSVMFLRQNWISTLLGFVPAAALVVAAFFGTNWAAHRALIPPYAHRSDGPVIASLSAESEAAAASTALAPSGGVPTAARLTAELIRSGELHRDNVDSPLRLLPTESPDRWIVETANGGQRFALQRAAEADAAGGRWNLHRWDNWYDYPGSYWTTPRRGVDRGEPRHAVYAFHLTLGHHGIFSLTPFWLLMPLGLYLRLQETRLRSRWWLTLAIITASLVCLAFYISRPLIDRNYGGVSSSFRWMLWFAPLWIWGLLPAVHECGLSRRGRWLVILLIGGSVFSVATSLESPWQHPWIYRYVDFLGWLRE